MTLVSPNCVKSLKPSAVQKSTSLITPNWLVKNLGVNFDQFINMYEHITS